MCAAWIAYVFVGYPLLMRIVALLRPHPLSTRPSQLPRIDVVVAAYNERENIGAKLENYVSFDYPRELLRCVIGSDGSTDGTDEIVRSYASIDPSISLVRYERSGKTHIIYDVAAQSDADIIVFTDADIILDSDALRLIAKCFSDPEVGGVVGTMVYHDAARGGATLGEGLYSRTENSLRRSESLAWTTVGPTGQCFAVRNGCYHPLSNDRLSDDTYLTISIPINGYRVWYEPTLRVHENGSRTLLSEITRRHRVGRQNAATFVTFRETRLPWRSRVGFQLWSHRILRNLCAVPFVLMCACALVLAPESALHTVCIWSVGVWMSFVVVGAASEQFNFRIGPIGYPAFFTAIMFTLTSGTIRAWVSGGQAQWQPPRV